MSIFKQIIDKKIPADIVYEDDLCLAFRDIQPQAPTHILVIPKKELPSLAEAQEQDKELFGHLLFTLTQIAEKLGLAPEGYRVVINTRDMGGQEVPHLHLHLLGGRQMQWPPG